MRVVGIMQKAKQGIILRKVIGTIKGTTLQKWLLKKWRRYSVASCLAIWHLRGRRQWGILSFLFFCFLHVRNQCKPTRSWWMCGNAMQRVRAGFEPQTPREQPCKLNYTAKDISSWPSSQRAWSIGGLVTGPPLLQMIERKNLPLGSVKIKQVISKNNVLHNTHSQIDLF